MERPGLFLIAVRIGASLLAGCLSSGPGRGEQRTGPVTPAITGKSDPDLVVDVYLPDKVFAGTTILPDNHDSVTSRIIEVDMQGRIVWEYPIPEELKRFTNPGFDVESLPDSHMLYVLPGYGIFEIDRAGKTVWSYRNAKISHDADRLLNGNTLVVFGNDDPKNDPQVREISRNGSVVWSWYAGKYFDKEPYSRIYRQGWTHTNAAQRLENGNTLISLRNFNIVVEVNPAGDIVRTIGEGMLTDQHDPVLLPSGNVLLANHGRPQKIQEIDPSGAVVWEYVLTSRQDFPARDANRLPNGNTLITTAIRIIEATPDRQVVWQLRLVNVTFTDQDAAAYGFYKAERIAG